MTTVSNEIPTSRAALYGSVHTGYSFENGTRYGTGENVSPDGYQQPENPRGLVADHKVGDVSGATAVRGAAKEVPSVEIYPRKNPIPGSATRLF